MKQIMHLLHQVERDAGGGEPDEQKDALLRQMHALRGKGIRWTLITMTLVEAINGARTNELHQAFEAVAGTDKCWERCYRLIALGYSQERQRAKEAKTEQ